MEWRRHSQSIAVFEVETKQPVLTGLKRKLRPLALNKNPAKDFSSGDLYGVCLSAQAVGLAAALVATLAAGELRRYSSADVFLGPIASAGLRAC